MDGGGPQWLYGDSSRWEIVGVFAKFRDESCPEAIGFSRSMGGLSFSLVPLGLNIACFCAELGFFGIERADQRTDGIQMLLGRELTCGRA